MKGTRHSEEQIIAILKQGEAGLTTAERSGIEGSCSSDFLVKGHEKWGVCNFIAIFF